MFGDDDLSAIFYAAGDGAVEFTLKDATPVKTFPAHMGEADEEVLQGYAAGTVRLIQYPSAAVELFEGDEITADSKTWRVLHDYRLINDGAESQTHLVPA